MPEDVEPLQPVEGPPPYEAALGCKVKAQGNKPRAFHSGAKPHLATLRNHSPVESLDRKAGRRTGKHCCGSATLVRRLLLSESDAARTAPARMPIPARAAGCCAPCACLHTARRPRVARDVFVKRSKQP